MKNAKRSTVTPTPSVEPTRRPLRLAKAQQLSLEHGVPRYLFYQEAAAKRLGSYRVGRRGLLFDRDEVATWITRGRRDAVA